MSEAEVLNKIESVSHKLASVCGCSIATAIELVGGYLFFVALKNSNPIVRFGTTVLVATCARRAATKGANKLIDFLDEKEKETENS